MALTDCFDENNIYYCIAESGDLVVGDNETASGSFNNYQFINLVIPAYAKDKKVTEIGKNSFSDKNKLTTVTILAEITQINQNAFIRCTSLSYINIPSTTTLICDLAISLKTDTANSAGATTIVFDYPSHVSYIGRYGIERKDSFIVYFYGTKAPKFDVYPFNGALNVVVYALGKMKFGGVKATVLTSFCKTLKQRKRYSYMNKLLLITFFLLYSS